MGWKNILGKLRGLPQQSSPEQVRKEYPNRFLKFYYLHHEQLKTERKNTYHQKKSKGLCIRCSLPAVSGINFCAYHREKIKEYNVKARQKLS